MLKKFSFTVLLIPLIIIFNGAMLDVEVIMLRAGTGSLNNAQNLPNYTAWYTVLIDTEYYKFTPDDPYGLPDSHDFSKWKHFFAIFPSGLVSSRVPARLPSQPFSSSWGSASSMPKSHRASFHGSPWHDSAQQGQSPRCS